MTSKRRPFASRLIPSVRITAVRPSLSLATLTLGWHDDDLLRFILSFGGTCYRTTHQLAHLKQLRRRQKSFFVKQFSLSASFQRWSPVCRRVFANMPCTLPERPRTHLCRGTGPDAADVWRFRQERGRLHRPRRVQVLLELLDQDGESLLA